MKIKLPRGFKLASKSLPRFGRNIIILKKMAHHIEQLGQNLLFMNVATAMRT